MITTDQGVGVRVSDGHAGLSGLATCGSLWACPTCSTKIYARRALEIGCAVAAAQAMGLQVGFMTLTMRHHRRQRLAHLWDALAKGWGRVVSGRAWVAEQDAYGLAGVLRMVETTYGVNGWHVHVHALVFGSDLDARKLDALCAGMWGRWSAGLVSKGLAAPLMHASEWHLVTGDLSGTKMGDYLAKGADAAGSIGMEMTTTQSKIARTVHSTAQVWSLLDSFMATGDLDALRLWHEWETASKGRRSIGWSVGLRELLGVGVVEKTDEEIAAEEMGSVDDTVVWIMRDGWARLLREPTLIPDLLLVAENESVDVLSAWLDLHKVEHRRV